MGKGGSRILEEGFFSGTVSRFSLGIVAGFGLIRLLGLLASWLSGLCLLGVCFFGFWLLGFLVLAFGSLASWLFGFWRCGFAFCGLWGYGFPHPQHQQITGITGFRLGSLVGGFLLSHVSVDVGPPLGPSFGFAMSSKGKPKRPP